MYNFTLPDIVWSVFKDADGPDIEEAVGEHLRHSTVRLKRKAERSGKLGPVMCDEEEEENKRRRENEADDEDH